MFRRPDVEAELTTPYGEKRTLRLTRRGWQLKRNESTVVLTMNRIAGPMVGAKIRALRIAKSLTLEQLCVGAGIVSGSPKQRMYEIEKGSRKEGVRLGTLYALAHTLGVPVSELLPSVEDVMAASGIKRKSVRKLAI